MTDEQKAFEAKWHHKILRWRGSQYEFLGTQRYYVTAALYDWEDGQTIFAIIGEDYNDTNKCWYTFRMSPKEVELLDSEFEFLPDDLPNQKNS
jgi:hypothetical protein